MRQTDFVILGLLSETPMTGYEIKKVIDVRFQFFWSESYGQIFPALKSLYENGLIEECRAEEQKRAKKRYQITAAGLRTLREWLSLPVERESIRLGILLKLYFSHLADPEIMLSHMRKFQAAHEEDLQILSHFEKELKPIADEENHLEVLRVIDFGQRVNKAYLDWSRETIQFLEGRMKP